MPFGRVKWVVMRGVLILVVPALLAGALLAGCGDDDDSGDADTVKASLKDYSINLDPTSHAQGEITFKINNAGPSQHEFVVVKTDLDAANLPYDSEKFEVDESSDKLTSVDEKEDINSGSSTSLEVKLQPGHYVIFCNIPTHYQQGMRSNFTVK